MKCITELGDTTSINFSRISMLPLDLKKSLVDNLDQIRLSGLVGKICALDKLWKSKL